jgi:DNA ligase 1
MLLQRVDEPFDSADYITELKLDGIRLIYSVDYDGKVRLYTRHNNEVTSKFPELTNLGIPAGTVLDGELIVTDKDGKPDFEAMMSRFMSERNSTPKVSFVAFDVIKYKNERVTATTLLERKELLTDIIKHDSAQLSKVQFITGMGRAYFDVVCDQSLEGIVLKRKDSRYHVGKRSRDWLKVINYHYTEVFITGYRKKEFGLLLSDLEGNNVGVMELGVPQQAKEYISNAAIIDENENFRFIEPLKCRVKFRHYTKAGLLRLPSFVEWA